MFSDPELFRNAYVPWDLAFSTIGSVDKKESGEDPIQPNIFTDSEMEYFYNFTLTPRDGNCFFMPFGTH